MRLRVSFVSTVPDARAAWYSIVPEGQPRDDLEKMRSLSARVNTMGRMVLGENFHRVDTYPTHLDFCVEAGTSKGPSRFDFRAFCGWIELCNMED